MQFLTTRDSKHLTEPKMVDLEDVLYIDSDNRKVVFHTHEGSFYLVDMLSAFARHLQPYGFRLLDRVNLVHLKKITHFDEEHHKVFFDRIVTKDSPYATVSFANGKSYIDEIRYWIEQNRKMQNP
ncbi:MAG: hypothetical protein BLM47_11345 [Candidatus Reconcilbacillus cellulovorans]|uniref:HTH LytTR-type domain-containing protein n=1 Tax=Candidatus Reconcilbacillus cellulovorans TaxID=1906605 RepID=A0A2A6DYC4_9BACL|nr:MAG: hypothetical protein BLM47_11345 [Candidatus Reconcilbacillus cellulovorans]